MQIYLAVTPAEAQEASRFRCSLAHVAYCIGPDSTLLRQNLLLQTRGGLLSVTDRGAPFIASPERLSAAALRECGRRSYGGVLLDFEQPPAPDRLAFAETLARRLSPRPVYVPESYAAASGAIPLICTAISGGNFVQRLQEAAAGRDRAGGLALDVQRLRMDFTLPAQSGEGRPLSGRDLQDLLDRGIRAGTAALDGLMAAGGASDWVRSLVIDGVCTGVGSVLSFLPIIVLLFFFLSLLEDSGYMARVAFVMDKLLRKIGLSGRSFVPMLIGFGCSVPAIMSARTLSSERDRKMTILLTPFMSCSAKLPIYGMIITAFFPTHRALLMLSVYLIGILVAILSGLLLKGTVFRGNPVPFVMELPAYRIPSPKSVLLLMWEKAKDFLRKAFTIIFVASIVIWFLQSFDLHLNMVADPSHSILAKLGSLIGPVFAPLGFTDWRASTALITGITAKESVVSTLTVLTGAATTADLSAALSAIFTPLSAFSFLVFTVLYMPCVAAFAASRRELGSTKGAILTAAYQTGAAYVVALAVYQIGSLFLR